MYDYAELAKAIVTDHTTYANGKQSYEPIYWDRGFSDTDEEAMSLFISGAKDKHDFPLWREKAYDVLMDWESDSIWEDACELVRQYLKDNEVPEDFDDGELRDAIRECLHDANTQDAALEWLQNMRQPIVRVMLTDEDHPDSWVEDDGEWSAERIATNAGIEHSVKNLKACQVILDNAYYPGTVKMLFLVFSLDLCQVDESADTVHIKGEAELWATNPFTGDGMADAVDVDLTVERSMLATDREACGYSYDEVFGPSYHNFPEPDVKFITIESEVKA